MSVKPGLCQYEFPIHNNVTRFLALSTVIEISSMVFLSGLAQQSRTQATSAALLAISDTETRHEAWALIEIWEANPFAGPSETVFPYANQILDYANELIVPATVPSVIRCTQAPASIYRRSGTTLGQYPCCADRRSPSPMIETMIIGQR